MKLAFSPFWSRSYWDDFDFRLLFVLALKGLLPGVYGTFRLWLLGSLPDTQSFSIASQSQWLGLIFEVCEEGMLLPLFFLLGSRIHDRGDFVAVVKSGAVVLWVVFGLLSILVILGARSLVISMEQIPSLIDLTVSYIRLESVGFFLGTLAKYFLIPLLLLKRSREVAWLLAAQFGSNLLCDGILIGSFPFSLNLNVVGVAWANILVPFGQIALAMRFLCDAGIPIFSTGAPPKNGWLWNWWIRGWRSGAESLVRNTAYAVMVLRLVNEVQGQKSFWAANQLMWGWLLVPVLALGEVIRRDTAERPDRFRINLPKYLLVTSLIALGWIACLPFLSSFIGVILKASEPAPVMEIVLALIGFYVIFAFNHVADSIFYGLGRTDFMLRQTLIVNITVYGIAYCLNRAGLFVPSVFKIVVLFGLGIATDAGITFTQLQRLLRAQTPQSF